MVEETPALHCRCPAVEPARTAGSPSRPLQAMYTHIEDVIFVESESNMETNAIHLPNNEDLNLSNNDDSVNLASMSEQKNPPEKSHINYPDKNISIDNNRTRLIDTNNKFKNNDAGPYLIFVEHKSLNIGRLHPMKLGEKLMQLSEYDKYITEISSVGKNRIKIEVNSGNIANKLVVEPFFNNNDLIAYIPNYLTEKKGIVRFVDTTYTEDVLLKIIKSDVPIKRVQRMTRMVTKDDKQERIPRQMVIITFADINIPQFIYINKVRCAVEIYIQPVMQCYNCLRFGHTNSQCKGKKKCKKCGSMNESECLECNTFCIFCKNNNHSSTFKDCPEFKKQKRTKEAMAQLNVSFKEAEKLVDNPAYTSLVKNNRYAPLISSDIEFPPLNIPQARRSVNTTPKPVRANITIEPTNPPKKRKTHDNTPHFPPIQREYKESFCAGPVISSITNAPIDVESIKNKLTVNIMELINDIFNNVASSSSNVLLDQFDIEKSLQFIVNNLFTQRNA